MTEAKNTKILEKFKNKKAAIFIDDANLFYMQKRVGWEIDWQKTKEFFEQYFSAISWRYYLGMPQKGKGRFENEKFTEELKQIGFLIKSKPLKKIYLDDRKIDFKHKCNFDVEIAFDLAKMIDTVDLAIIMSGDSDFLEAKNFCLGNGKNFLMVCFEKRVAWEIRRIYHIFFEDIKEFVQKINPDK